MRQLFSAVCICFLTGALSGQTGQADSQFNLGFEKPLSKDHPSDNWIVWGSGYEVKRDTIEKHSGTTSLHIQPKAEAKANDFGCGAYKIPANYLGKTITLRAWMKFKDVSKGSVGLLLRIDGEGTTLEFDNMNEKNIQGTSDWKHYSVELPLPENATKIFIGGLLSGTGQLWMDDFEVLIDGKDISKAKLKKQSKAEFDREFDNGSNISSVDLSKTDDLVVLGEVWGFLKYYHPAVAKGDYNWDYELFRVMPKILAAKDQDSRNAVLNSWVASLGKVNAAKGETKGNVKLQPDLAWIDAAVLGNELATQLNTIKNAERSGNSYYIGLAPGVGNPEFKHENAYAKMQYPDAGFRMLCLFRYWNMIHYYFPYKNLIEKNWNDVLKEFVPTFISAANELEYKQAVLGIIANIHDTHANIWSQDEALRTYKGLNYAPVEITFIENKAVVSDYYDKALAEQSGLKIGDVIESINNKPVEEIIKAKLPLTPASNYPTQLRDISMDLLRTNDTVLNLGYRHNGELLSGKISCFNEELVQPFRKYSKTDTCFKMISPEISYLYPGTMKDDYLPLLMPSILKTKGLIIDFRCYPSAFLVYSLSDYLLPEKTDFVKFSNGSITTPGLFVMVDNDKIGSKNKNYYKGKVVIIVNETTQSSAEYHSMAFRTAPQAIVIGSTTAGADGNVSRFMLPGGISTMISGIGVYYPDGKETQRIGIVPDVEVKPTISGIKEGRDELLQKAIEIINAK